MGGRQKQHLRSNNSEFIKTKDINPQIQEVLQPQAWKIWRKSQQGTSYHKEKMTHRVRSAGPTEDCKPW